MKFTRNKRHVSEVSAGALTDIMFFLLLFFLIVSTTANPNVIKLLLPESSPSSDIAKNYKTVSVTSDSKYYLAQEEIPEADLFRRIEEATQGDETEKMIILRVDKDVPSQNLVRVLDIGMQLKLRVVLETKRSGN